MSKSNFNQFIQKNEKGAKLKESIRQEKKKLRQETKEFFAQRKQKNKPIIEQGPASEARRNTSAPPRRLTPATGGNTTASEGKRTPARLITKNGGNQPSKT